ncbi:MAG: hypothetical protein R3A79_15985 [Nannocystaceae bacterium]
MVQRRRGLGRALLHPHAEGRLTALDYARLVASTYDAQYADIRDDTGDRERYAGLAAERGGPALELGCDRGRGDTLVVARRR